MPNRRQKLETKPKPTLTFIGAVAVIVGIVMEVGMFKTPALVAANVKEIEQVVL